MTSEQIRQGLLMSIKDRITFVENFMKLSAYSQTHKSKLISLKVPEDLLNMFREKCALEDIAYQTKIKELMRQWCLNEK